jgi:hypothetical protein
MIILACNSQLNTFMKSTRSATLLKFFSILLISASFFLLNGCSNGPGAGGRASITGKIKAQDYTNNCTTLNGEYFAPDEDVYIIYGDDPTYGDRVKTGPDGTFMFRYLRKGSYKIYVYSDDCSVQSGTTAVQVTVEITGRKEEADAGTLTVKR